MGRIKLNLTEKRILYKPHTVIVDKEKTVIPDFLNSCCYYFLFLFFSFCFEVKLFHSDFAIHTALYRVYRQSHLMCKFHYSNAGNPNSWQSCSFFIFGLIYILSYRYAKKNDAIKKGLFLYSRALFIENAFQIFNLSI